MQLNYSLCRALFCVSLQNVERTIECQRGGGRALILVGLIKIHFMQEVCDQNGCSIQMFSNKKRILRG